jgi:hypothetical protein
MCAYPIGNSEKLCSLSLVMTFTPFSSFIFYRVSSIYILPLFAEEAFHLPRDAPEITFLLGMGL